jgi:galactonate dehydratase
MKPDHASLITAAAGVHIVDVSARVLNVSDKTNWFFLRVEDSAGRIGWGEATLIGWEPVMQAALTQRLPHWRGLPLCEVREAVRVAPRSAAGLVGQSLVSAFLQACASLQAQYLGTALHAVLGALLRREVPLYANINRATRDRTPAGFVQTARRAREHGYTRFKAAPFDGLLPRDAGSSQARQRIHHGIDCMLALREALGPEALLMVDCHWRFDEASALQTLADLAPARLHWFECPIAETHAHWPALRRIRHACAEQGVRLAAAETQIGLESFQTVFDEGLYDVVMPDVKYCGGPWEMLRIAQAARRAGVGFSPHNPSGPICTWHSLHVAAVAPECAMLEVQFDESPLYEQLLEAPLWRGQAVLEVDRAVQVPGLAQSVLDAHPWREVPQGIEALLG